MVNKSAIQWLETELSYLEETSKERSLSLQLDLITEAFKEAKVKEKDNLEKAFRFSDSYFSFKMFYKYEIDDNG